MSQKITPLYSNKASGKQGLSFVAGIKDEMKKVSWTEKSELQHCTKIVLATTLFFGLGIYIVDLMIKGMLDSLGLIGKWIAQ